MKAIITKQDIISTYDARQQEQCRLYEEYKRIKKENPTFGYKRISKILGQPEAKTRWWHCGKYTPVPIQTVEYLEEKNLLPLNENNPQLILIAKIIGATFADGGIFGNLNAIFLSSSELEAVQEFGEDLKKVFGEEIGLNSRIIEGGEYGHSWCYQNTNRNCIRFFMALGSPIGKKSQIKLVAPDWIFLNELIADNFVGSIIGGDGAIPKYVCGTPNTIYIGITGREHVRTNRIEFLESLRKYFTLKGISTNKIYITPFKDSNIFRLSLVTTLDNFIQFENSIKMDYCKYKKEKLKKTIRMWQTYRSEKTSYLLNERRKRILSLKS